jgi:hypothetical protein
MRLSGAIVRFEPDREVRACPAGQPLIPGPSPDKQEKGEQTKTIRIEHRVIPNPKGRCVWRVPKARKRGCSPNPSYAPCVRGVALIAPGSAPARPALQNSIIHSDLV